MPRWPNMTIKERFDSGYEKRGPNECWPWIKSKHPYGYGYMGVGSKGVDRKMALAHRLSYEFNFGPIPDNSCVCHRCDNPPCVNPAHLFVGSRKDNAYDSIAKNRNSYGDRHASKLTSDDVAVIRALYRCGVFAQTTIAKQYGISKGLAWDVVHKRVWKRLDKYSAMAAAESI